MDWGLAWSEAAPYAADLGMKYEQARRTRAEGELFDLELQEKMEQTEHTTDLNREVRAAQKAITENKEGILAGNIDSYLKAKNALASGTGYSWVKISDSKIGIMDAKGNINQDSIRDLSSKEWKNPAARIAELEKSAKTIMDMASQYRSDVEKNKKDDWEREKFYAEEEGKNKRNEADNRTKLSVARIGKEATLLGLSGGGGGTSKVDVDEKHVAAANNYAARAVLGVNVSAKADENNTMRFYTPDGAEVPVTDKQRDLINRGAQWILTDANNTAATRNLAIDVALGDSALTLQHSVNTAKTVNPERKKRIEEEAKKVSALFTNNKGVPTTGGILPLVGTADRYKTAGRGLEVTGKLSTSPSPFGKGIPGGLAGSEWNSTPIQYVTDVLGETYVN